MDHPLNSLPDVVAAPPTDEEFGSLSAEIARFLDDPDYLSLSVTIRFTDHGLSLGRGDQGCEMHFFTHPRLDPDEESKILALFAGIDLQPIVDYSCDRGRTRVLHFAIPGDRDPIVQLCRHVLTGVYQIGRGDALDYHLLTKADLGSGSR